MPNKDFFLSFGSDAKTFSENLTKDLAGAEETLTRLSKLVEKVNGPQGLRGRTSGGGGTTPAQPGRAATVSLSDVDFQNFKEFADEIRSLSDDPGITRLQASLITFKEFAGVAARLAADIRGIRLEQSRQPNGRLSSGVGVNVGGDRVQSRDVVTSILAAARDQRRSAIGSVPPSTVAQARIDSAPLVSVLSSGLREINTALASGLQSIANAAVRGGGGVPAQAAATIKGGGKARKGIKQELRSAAQAVDKANEEWLAAYRANADNVDELQDAMVQASALYAQVQAKAEALKKKGQAQIAQAEQAIALPDAALQQQAAATVQAGAQQTTSRFSPRRQRKIDAQQKILDSAKKVYDDAVQRASEGVEEDLAFLQAQVEGATRDLARLKMSKRDRDQARLQARRLASRTVTDRLTADQSTDTLTGLEKIGTVFQPPVALRQTPLEALNTRFNANRNNKEYLTVAEMRQIIAAASQVGLVPIDPITKAEISPKTIASKKTTRDQLMTMLTSLAEQMDELPFGSDGQRQFPIQQTLRSRRRSSTLDKATADLYAKIVAIQQTTAEEAAARELTRLNIETGGISPIRARGTKGRPGTGGAFGGSRDEQVIRAYAALRAAQQSRGVAMQDTVLGMLSRPGGAVDFHDPTLLGRETGTTAESRANRQAMTAAAREAAEIMDLVKTLMQHEAEVQRANRAVDRAARGTDQGAIDRAIRRQFAAMDRQRAFQDAIAEEGGPGLLEALQSPQLQRNLAALNPDNRVAWEASRESARARSEETRARDRAMSDGLRQLFQSVQVPGFTSRGQASVMRLFPGITMNSQGRLLPSDDRVDPKDLRAPQKTIRAIARLMREVDATIRDIETGNAAAGRAPGSRTAGQMQVLQGLQDEHDQLMSQFITQTERAYKRRGPDDLEQQIAEVRALTQRQQALQTESRTADTVRRAAIKEELADVRNQLAERKSLKELYALRPSGYNRLPTSDSWRVNSRTGEEFLARSWSPGMSILRYDESIQGAKRAAAADKRIRDRYEDLGFNLNGFAPGGGIEPAVQDKIRADVLSLLNKQYGLNAKTLEDLSRSVKQAFNDARAVLRENGGKAVGADGKIDSRIRHAADRLGVNPADLTPEMVANSAAAVERANIQGLRKVLERMGITWSETFNDSLGAAKTIDEVFEAIARLGGELQLVSSVGARKSKPIGTLDERNANFERVVTKLIQDDDHLRQLMADVQQQGATPLDGAQAANISLQRMTRRQRELLAGAGPEGGGLSQEQQFELEGLNKALRQWESIRSRADVIERIGRTTVRRPDTPAASASTEIAATPELQDQLHRVNALQAQVKQQERVAAIDQVARVMEENQRAAAAGVPQVNVRAGAMRDIYSVAAAGSRSFSKLVSAHDIEGVKRVADGIRVSTEKADALRAELAAEEAKLAHMRGGGAGGDGGGVAVGAGGRGGFEECCARIVAAVNNVARILTSGQAVVRGAPASATPGAAVAGAVNTAASYESSTQPNIDAIAKQRFEDEVRKQQKATRDARTGRYEDIRSGLSPEALREVDKLAAIDKASVKTTQEKIAYNKQLDATYRALYATMANLSASERRRDIKTVFAGAGHQMSGDDVKEIGQRVGDYGRRAGNEYGGQMADSAMSAFESRLFGSSGFWNRVLHSTGTFLIRNFSAGFVFGLTNALQEVVRQGIETEAVFVRVQSALEATGRAAGDMRTQLVGISTDYGVPLENVYKTAASLTGMFDNVSDISAATRIIAQLDMISGGALSAGEGIGALSSVTSAYGITGPQDLANVADVLTVIQNRLGTNIEVTAEGLGRIAGLAKQLGLPLEDAATYIGAIAKLTNQTGAAAGEQFQRIIAVMQSGRGQSVLLKELAGTGIDQALRPDAGGMRDYNRAIQILLESYSGLTQAQRENITVTLGGQRQAAALNALLEQGPKVLETARAAHNANGEAQKRAAAIAQQLNTELQIMQQDFTSLGAELVRSGVLNFFGLLVKALNLTVGTAAKFLSTVNTLADNNTLLGWLRGATGLAVGMAVAVTLGAKAWQGLAAAMTTAAGAARAMAGAQGVSAAGNVLEQAGQLPLFVGPGAGPAATDQVRRRGLIGGVNRAGESLASRASRLGLYGYELGGLAANAGYRAGLAGRSIGQSALFGRELRGAGVDEALTGSRIRVAALRAEQTALNVASKASQGAARAMEGLGNAIGNMTWKSVAGLAGITALALAIGSVITRQMDRATTVEDIYKQSFTKEGRDKAAGSDTQPYIGPATDAWRTIMEQGGDFTDLFKRGLQGYNYLSGPGVFSQIGSMIANRTFNPFDERTALAQSQLGDIGYYDNTKFGNAQGYSNSLTKRITDLTKQPTITADAVSRLQTSLMEELDKRATEIKSDGDLSEEQKTHALSDLEQIRIIIDKRIRDAYNLAQGVKDFDALMTDQISKIDELTNSLSTINQAGSVDISQWSVGLMNVIEDIGLQAESTIKPLLVQLAGGSTGRGDFLRSMNTILKKEADSALTEWQTSVRSGAEQQEIDANRTSFLNKVAAVAQNEADIVQADLDSYQKKSTALLRTGTERANQQGLAALQARVTLLQARKSQLISARGDAIAQAQDAVDKAQADYEEAAVGEASKAGKPQAGQAQRLLQLKTNLDDLKAKLAGLKAGSPNFADINAQIMDAEEAEFNAQSEIVKSIAASRSARTRNPLAQANIALGDINERLRLARAPGTLPGTTVASAATIRQLEIDQQNALNARNDAVADLAAAQRQTAVARIAPGASIAIARANLANAQKAQEEAKKFKQDSPQYQQAVQQTIAAQNALDEALRSRGLALANLGVALANARNNGLESAQASLQVARLTLAQALEKSGGEQNAETIAAQAGVVSAQKGVQDALQANISSHSDLAVAVANAAGKSVKAARLTLTEARRKLQVAIAQGAGEAEINAAKANVVQAEAAQRDAILNDRLGTIDFNQQMGRMTSSAAITALRQVLKTADLTRDQRRQVLLKIKGLTDELGGDSQWNIGDIKVPTPYEMRRYVVNQTGVGSAARMRAEGWDASLSTVGRNQGQSRSGAIRDAIQQVVEGNSLQIFIDGADIGMVKEVLRKEYGEQVLATAGTKRSKTN